MPSPPSKASAASSPDATKLTEDLIRLRSVTPDDAGCRELLAEHLCAHGFTREDLDRGEVSNVWFRHGEGEPLFAFSGHMDVVPPGPEDEWDTPPFTPTTRDGVLYGRGAADMKSGVAAMTVACMRFVSEQPQHAGSCAFMLTSDEEGDAVDGTRRIIEQLRARGDAPRWCVVGEPSADKQVGDTIRIGRRGSLTAALSLHGVQGHVAYPDKARNPIHMLAPALNALCAREWGQSEEPFPPTGLQIVDIRAGVGVDNVIPGDLSMRFNFRYAPPVTADRLRQGVAQILDDAGLDYELDWTHGAEPFLSKGGDLLDAARAAIGEVSGCETVLSTGGGTSDGRFIASPDCELIELGVPNATIHKANECVRLDDIKDLVEIYLKILRRLLA